MYVWSVSQPNNYNHSPYSQILIQLKLDKPPGFHIRGLNKPPRKPVLSSFGCVGFSVTPWTVAHQAPLSTGFFRLEYWSGLSFPPPGDLPNPGIEPLSLLSPAVQILYPLSHLGSPTVSL